MFTSADVPSIRASEAPATDAVASPAGPATLLAAHFAARRVVHALATSLDYSNALATMLGDSADRGAPTRPYVAQVQGVGACLDGLLDVLSREARDVEDAAGRALDSGGPIEVGGSTCRGVLVGGRWRVVQSPLEFVPNHDGTPIVAGHAVTAIDDETA